MSVVAHNPEDALLHKVLKQKRHVGFYDLAKQKPPQIMAAYREADLVIGMRTHSQDIPFGMGIPIISILNHDKLTWTLDDLGFPHWGVDLFDTEFSTKVSTIASSIFSDYRNYKIAIIKKQQEITNITINNIKFIKSKLIINK